MNSNLNDFLSFRRMITPSIIQVLFWIGVVVNIFGGLVMIISGGTEALIGILMLIIGPFIVRIWCEMLILFFRMNETLTDIKNNIQK